MTLEEYKKEVDKNINSLFEKASNEEKKLLNIMINLINCLCKEKQELIDYLKEKIKERDKEIKLLGQDCYTSKYAYEEILSKLEKSDNL